MEFLEILLKKQAELVATSFILGLIFGFSYDIIRIYYILCSLVSYSGGSLRHRGGLVPFLLRFFGDLIWTLTAGLAFSLYVYRENDGAFRWFMAASAAAGFALWHSTAGQLVVRAASAAASVVRRIAGILLLRPLGALFGILGAFFRILWRQTGGRTAAALGRRRAERRTERARREFAKDTDLTGSGEACV